MSELLTTSEVAARLRRPETTLRYWRHKGEGPASFRLGGRVVYDAADVSTWIQNQRNQSCKGDRR